MQRLGANCWPINTVQFSNHTQYGAWKGQAIPDEQISLLVDGIADRGVLGKADAVLSGYLGSAAMGGHVLRTVDKIKALNPSAIWCCDPVMGHPEKGCIVPDGVAEFFKTEAAPRADVLCPNVLELGILSGMPTPTTLAECVDAARSLLSREEVGPKMVLAPRSLTADPSTLTSPLALPSGVTPTPALTGPIGSRKTPRACWPQS